MTKEEHTRLSNMIDEGYVTDKLEPIKCTVCEGKNFTEEVLATDGGYTSEYKVYCNSCGEQLGY